MWNADGAEWIIEARCWVLRNRARSHRRSVLDFLGHNHTELLRVGVWWVAGAGSHQTVGVGVLFLGVLFPWGGVFTWQVVVNELVFLPVF